MKTISIFLIFFGLTSVCYPANNYFQVRTERNTADSNSFSFPVFSNPADNYVSNKINETLQIGELELLKGYEENNIFEVVRIDGGTIYGGKVGMDFTIYDNNSRVLSIKLDQSSCGATCTYWVNYYNFNSGNGDLVRLDDLFTQEGFEKFSKFASKRRIARHKKEIEKLEPADRSSFEEIIGSYKVDDLGDFYIRNNALYIDGENSFLKNQKFSGVKTVTKFRLAEFKHHLNNYGKSLFSIKNHGIKNYRSKKLPQIFHGKIGDSDVTLVLSNYYGRELKAEYVYLKYGRGIFLEGIIKNNLITMTEKLPVPRESSFRDGKFIDYIDNGKIEAEIHGRSIIGTWTSQDGKKTHQLRLNRK